MRILLIIRLAMTLAEVQSGRLQLPQLVCLSIWAATVCELLCSSCLQCSLLKAINEINLSQILLHMLYSPLYTLCHLMSVIICLQWEWMVHPSRYVILYHRHLWTPLLWHIFINFEDSLDNLHSFITHSTTVVQVDQFTILAKIWYTVLWYMWSHVCYRCIDHLRVDEMTFISITACIINTCLGEW